MADAQKIVETMERAREAAAAGDLEVARALRVFVRSSLLRRAPSAVPAAVSALRLGSDPQPLTPTRWHV